MAKKLSKQQLSSTWTPGGKPLGILGGGQLARMLALKAHSLGIPVAVLSESKGDPAAQVTSNWHQGRLDNAFDLTQFLKKCSTVTFESEFLDADVLAKLENQTGTAIWPKAQHMQIVQDRLSQKDLLKTYRVPTALYFKVDTFQEAKQALKDLGGKAVFKKRRFGYDGYGTFVIRNLSELESFEIQLSENKSGFIAEAFVPFQRELALMMVRGKNGDLIRLPVVESRQENSKCLWVKGPIREGAKLSTLIKSMQALLTRLEYVGAIGIELFETKQGYLVNELAPRVHNSGHYSMNALSDDQFALHLKAVLGLSLQKPTALAKGFAMINLIGESGEHPSWTLNEGTFLHWYGKTENRKGRKMGHVNTLGSSSEKALQLALKARKNFSL